MEYINSRHRVRRQRRQRFIRTVAAVFIGFALVWFGWSYTHSGPGTKSAQTINIDQPKAKSKKTAKSVVSQRTFVVLGVDENGGKESVKGALELVYDPAQNKVSGLSVDPNTYVPMPTRGLQSIDEGFGEGAKDLAAAISEMTGVKAEGYVVLKGDVYANIVADKKPGEFFSRREEGSMSATEAKALSAKFGAVAGSRVKFVSLPVKTMVVGEQTYYQSDKAELKRLVTSIWGKQPPLVRDAVRVIILNGNGTPGVARTAADRLGGKGFKILDVKNADKFTYTKTEILVYNAKAKKSGTKAVKALGAGIVIDKEAAQDVTDLVILIGKDFH